MQVGNDLSTAGILGDHPELLDSSKIIPTVSREFPFLIEKTTGVVYPYTDRMAERGDLVEGCYDMRGSKNPLDRPKDYDPLVAKNVQRLQDAKRTVLPSNQAEFQAKLLEIEQQTEARIRAEYAENHKLEQANWDEPPPKVDDVESLLDSVKKLTG